MPTSITNKYKQQYNIIILSQSIIQLILWIRNNTHSFYVILTNDIKENYKPMWIIFLLIKEVHVFYFFFLSIMVSYVIKCI